MIEYKSIPFEVKEVVPTEGGGWEVAGLASTWGGEPDSYGDVVVRGAFAESIAKRATKFLYEHMEPIGKQIAIEENDEGLFGRWSIVDTRAGEDAYKLVKSGVLDSLSIGYFTLEADYREDGVRLLRKCDLFEVSAVAIPANRNAVITDVKSLGRPFEQHSEAVKATVSEWLSRVKSGSDIRATDGRALSEARKALIAAMSGSLRNAADEVEALLVPPASPERINLGMELTRRRLARHGILERPAS
ncbi:MAG TPA: HK97 family phage prohead protease [Thermomicrobiales bacterium]|nr:HK97 family phage prohead protease [Thermomicrobiales bacterium]